MVISLVTALCPCRPVKFEQGIFCECTESYCDTLNVPKPKSGNQFVLITSSKQGERFAYQKAHIKTIKCIKASYKTNVLIINPEKKYKRSKIIGFGGAFTDAVTYVLTGFSPELRAKFYQSYFSPKLGIGYNFVRVPIGGTDYSLEPWTYDNQTKPDPKLKHFERLDGRDVLRNIYIKDVQKCAKMENLKIIASVWTPPLWMKAKHELFGSADNRLIPAFYQSYADYCAKWINLMDNDGVKIWAISPGNEPIYAQQPTGIPALSWQPGNQAVWIADYLAPKIKKIDQNTVKIGLFDDNRQFILGYLEKMEEQRPNVIKCNDFIFMHGYLDNITSPEILDTLYERYAKQILYTEMSWGYGQSINTDAWIFAEQLIHILMEALQHDVAGYIDWNMILDSNRGPSILGEQSIEPYLLANQNFTAFYKQPLYYAMAHFAKFIPRKSIRIDATLLGNDVSQVQTVAYLRPDKRISIILYNNDNVDSVSLTVIDALKGKIPLLLKPQSVYTLIYSNVENQKPIKNCS